MFIYSQEMLSLSRRSLTFIEPVSRSRVSVAGVISALRLTLASTGTFAVAPVRSRLAVASAGMTRCRLVVDCKSAAQLLEI